jgi:hypothetical protein
MFTACCYAVMRDRAACVYSVLHSLLLPGRVNEWMGLEWKQTLNMENYFAAHSLGR